MKRIHLPDGVDLSSGIFKNRLQLTTLVYGDTSVPFQQGVIDLTGYTGTSYAIGLFDNCNEIERVRLNSSTAIPSKMFYSCENFASLPLSAATHPARPVTPL